MAIDINHSNFERIVDRFTCLSKVILYNRHPTAMGGNGNTQDLIKNNNVNVFQEENKTEKEFQL